MASTRVLHIIGSLSTGGAEIMLWKLLAAGSSNDIEHAVISLKAAGPIAGKIESLGVPVASTNMRSMTSLPAALWQVRHFARTTRPHVIHGWMYHGNAVALLASDLFLRRPPVVWSIRHSIYDLRDEKKSTARVIRWGAKVSSRAKRIIYNSGVSADQHEAIGYSPHGRIIIPNGFDCDRFKPSPDRRGRIRRSLGVSDETPLIGMVARYHPMKDHETLAKAARILIESHSDVRFVLAGTHIDDGNAELLELLDGIRDRFYLLGEREDIPDITAALDVATLSSSSEAFPNAIGEAMACGVPVVATDVGESAAILGNTGRIVPARDAAAMAKAWMDLLELDPGQRASLGRQARERVQHEFLIEQVALRYDDVHTGVTKT